MILVIVWLEFKLAYDDAAVGGACGVMVIVIGNGYGDCISHSTNILGKGMNPIILPPAMGK